MSNSQALLFSEPSIAETGVWCSLNEGIDPSEWASMCRYIGNLSPRAFGETVKAVKGRENAPVGIPLVSIGPSGVGGEYQREGRSEEHTSELQSH